MNLAKKRELLQKGWTEKEIREAEASLERAEKQDVHFSKIVFWSALIVIIFGNVVLSLILIPFLIVFNQYILYSITILLAGALGFLYNLLIMDIGHLQRKHHVLASIIIPVLAITNMVIVVFVSNNFIKELTLTNPTHNPLIVGIVFAVAFILPYVFSRLFGYRKNMRKALVH